MTDETNQLPAEVKLTPIMQMMETAVARGDIEVVTKLMDLQERAEAAQARREFDAAFAAVKAKVGIIRKTGKANYGLYADLADIARALDPAIAEHGLSYRFRSARVGNELVMTCVVCHRAGHYEENSLPSPLDTSGSKNPVQAVGSTSTYLQRYTLIQAFGLASSVNGDIHDDDGAAADVHQPGDYVGNGTRAKDTEPKGPQTFSRRDIAEITKITSVTTLHDWGAAHSSQVNGYPHDIRDKVYKAFRARLAELEAIADQVIIDDDGERPARPEDFAEDTAEQIAGSISERAVAARETGIDPSKHHRAREYTRPPNLQEVGPYDFPELPPDLDRRR